MGIVEGEALDERAVAGFQGEPLAGIIQSSAIFENSCNRESCTVDGFEFSEIANDKSAFSGGEVHSEWEGEFNSLAEINAGEIDGCAGDIL